MCRSHLAYSVPYFPIGNIGPSEIRRDARRGVLANHGKPTLLPHLHSNLRTYVLNRGSSSSCIHVGLLTTSLGAAKMPIVRSKLQMINNIRPSPPSTRGLYAQLEKKEKEKEGKPLSLQKYSHHQVVYPRRLKLPRYPDNNAFNSAQFL